MNKQKRGKYKRERKKKFKYLKNTGQFDNYYNMKKHKEPIKEPVKEIKEPVKEIKEPIKEPETKPKWFIKLWRRINGRR